MWTLACILPLVVQDDLSPLIDQDDPHRKKNILLENGGMLFSDSINKNFLPYSSVIIAEHLSGYQALYDNLLIKDHFMTHNPSQLLSYGTFNDFICLRMEACHKFLKRQARAGLEKKYCKVIRINISVMLGI